MGVTNFDSVTLGGDLTVGGTTTITGNISLAGSNTFGDSSADTQTLKGATSITTSSASGLAVGLNGATNPALTVDASTASSATGIKVKSAAATGGVAVSVTSSGTDENLTIDAKGSGTVTIANTSTGNVAIQRALTVNGTFQSNGATTLAGGEAVSAGGGANAYCKFGTGGTISIRFGSGAPTVSAGKGSLYLRTDGSTTNDRMYVNTDGGTTWTAVITAA